MDVKKLATEYHEKGFNCAQAVLCANCAHTGLDEKTSLAVSGGFGGGLRCGEVCGAVSGAVMAMVCVASILTAVILKPRKRLQSLHGI